MGEIALTLFLGTVTIVCVVVGVVGIITGWDWLVANVLEKQKWWNPLCDGVDKVCKWLIATIMLVFLILIFLILTMGEQVREWF